MDCLWSILQSKYPLFRSKEQRKLCVLIYCSQQAGGLLLQEKLQSIGVPCLYIESVKSFYFQYCQSFLTPSESYSFSQIIDYFHRYYHRVLTIHIHRDPVPLKIESFFCHFVPLLRQYVWRENNPTLLYQKWDALLFSEKKDIFERILFSRIQCHSYLENTKEFPFWSPSPSPSGETFLRHPSQPNTFFLQLSFDHAKEWEATLSYYLGLPPSLSSSSSWWSWNPELLYPKGNKERLFFKDFQQFYQPSSTLLYPNGRNTSLSAVQQKIQPTNKIKQENCIPIMTKNAINAGDANTTSVFPCGGDNV